MGWQRSQEKMCQPSETKIGLPSNFIRTIYQDRNGFIWVGTNGGLSRGKDGKWESFTEKTG